MFFLAAIIRENSDKRFWIEIVKVLPFIQQPDCVARKASDVQQLIGDIKHARKKYRFVFSCAVKAFLRAGNPSTTP